MTPVRPSTRAMTPILSSGPSLRTTIDDMSAPAWTWWPITSGRHTGRRGLSTWKVKIVVTPAASISSSAPDARSAESSPPCPSGDSARRSGASSRIAPSPWSTAGSVPWTTNRADAGSRPKWSCSAKNARVSPSFCGEVRTYQGIGAA